jgi:hypothetical protein
MLITTKMERPDLLTIDCYTFNAREWTALENTLSQADVSLDFSSLGGDTVGRDGRRYHAEGLGRIGALATLLRGSFRQDGRF